ncbi:hypothetical protein H1C71_009350 [Ictidomys tridecemlineatus]|nr:hypothetical protein H1C71_009350 [Ictidomys tridecemlineatus]
MALATYELKKMVADTDTSEVFSVCTYCRVLLDPRISADAANFKVLAAGSGVGEVVGSCLGAASTCKPRRYSAEVVSWSQQEISHLYLLYSRPPSCTEVRMNYFSRVMCIS